MDAPEYLARDRTVWEGIFAGMPAEWYEAPPSDAMIQARSYFEAQPCRRLLDLGCGFGRWAQFLAGRGAGEINGVDYAHGGIRAARAWAERAGFSACFVVGSVLAPPFRGRTFDGVLAALILDNLSRADCLESVRAVNGLVRPRARGFFVFNPVVTAAEPAAAADDNPTTGCMQVAYADDELAACLPGWSVTRVGVSTEGLRIVEATGPG